MFCSRKRDYLFDKMKKKQQKIVHKKKVFEQNKNKIK